MYHLDTVVESLDHNGLSSDAMGCAPFLLYSRMVSLYIWEIEREVDGKNPVENLLIVVKSTKMRPQLSVKFTNLVFLKNGTRDHIIHTYFCKHFATPTLKNLIG